MRRYILEIVIDSMFVYHFVVLPALDYWILLTCLATVQYLGNMHIKAVIDLAIGAGGWKIFY